MILSGLILRRIFDRNQEEFTAADPKTIPTIAVVEEAQAVLNESGTAAEPYIAWVKEGRKYDLGAVLVTQQPGSIPNEILSQGDNWFIFHLLSGGDLGNVRRANAHFSDDLLSVLLNEPIPGQGVFWSSVEGKPYPVPIRVVSFEAIHNLRDPDYRNPAGKTYAATLRERFENLSSPHADATDQRDTVPGQEEEAPPVDVLRSIEAQAIREFSESEWKERVQTDGAAWGGLKAFFLEVLPDDLDDPDNMAYQLVPKALNQIFGQQDIEWHTFKNPSTGANWVKTGTAS